VKVFLREDIYKSPTGGGGFLAGVMTLNYNIYIPSECGDVLTAAVNHESLFFVEIAAHI
jgi:hypothetical protein